MKKFRPINSEFEAITYDGTNTIEVKSFCSDTVFTYFLDGRIGVQTETGLMVVSIGDTILKSVDGLRYRCFSPEEIRLRYEEVPQESISDSSAGIKDISSMVGPKGEIITTIVGFPPENITTNTDTITTNTDTTTTGTNDSTSEGSSVEEFDDNVRSE